MGIPALSHLCATPAPAMMRIMRMAIEEGRRHALSRLHDVEPELFNRVEVCPEFVLSWFIIILYTWIGHENFE